MDKFRDRFVNTTTPIKISSIISITVCKFYNYHTHVKFQHPPLLDLRNCSLLALFGYLVVGVLKYNELPSSILNQIELKQVLFLKEVIPTAQEIVVCGVSRVFRTVDLEVIFCVA